MKPTQEQVIAWAREAGFEDWHWTSLEGESELDRTLQVGEYPVGESVFALVSLAYEAGRKDENEACAVRVSEVDADGWEVNMAEIIRARREQ